MNALIGYIFLFLVIGIVPLLLGFFWVDLRIDESRVAVLLYSYVMGLFSMMAVFEVCFFFAALYYIRFTTISMIFSGLLFLLSIASIVYFKKKNIYSILINANKNKWKWSDCFYFMVFCGLLMYQLYYAFFYSRTYMAADGYVAFSSSAIADNYIDLTNIYTGEYLAHGVNWIRRAIQSFNYMAAYLSYISGINTAIVGHTIMYAGVVIIAYIVYYLMSCQLFNERDDRLIFMSLLALLFIWGYHSHYSLSFRLLGPNDSGKAILAVVLTPFMMTIMHRVIDAGYQVKIGFQIFVLSIVACSFTLGGVYTFAALLVGLVFIPMLKRKSPELMLYLLWGGLVPATFAVVYLVYRYTIF